MTEEHKTNPSDDLSFEGYGKKYHLEAAQAQANLVEKVVSMLDEQVQRLITVKLVEKLKRIYITGCGDSYFAGVCARYTFDRYTGLCTEAVEALEFSRYLVDFIPTDSLVFPISYSGRVARTLETAILARQRGATVIGITGYDTGLLVDEVDAALVQGLPREDEALGGYDEWHHVGMGNFIVSLISLYLIAFRIAELRGKLTTPEVNALKEDLILIAPVIARTSKDNIQTAQEIAADLWNLNDFTFIGGGPSYGTAMFSAAKILEQPNLNGVPSELEEWAHLQYFLVRPNTTAVFVIAPPGRSRDRAMEQIRGIQDMGGKAIAICAEEDEEMIKLAYASMPVKGVLREEFSPLAYIIPGQLFATSLHHIRGFTPLFAPFDLQRQEAINRRQIRESRMRITI